MKARSVSKAIKNGKTPVVDRNEFDAVLAKLIAAPPTPKAMIAGKIKAKSRLRPLTKPLLQK